MIKEIVATKIFNITNGLKSFSPESDSQLDTIRRVVGYNLLNNRQVISLSNFQATEFEPEPFQEKVTEFRKFAVNKLMDDDKFIVKKLAGKENIPTIGSQMGEARLPINPLETFSEWRWNQKVGERLGPFNSPKGVPVWFDFYYFEDKLTVRTQNDNAPYFLFSKARQSVWADRLKRNQTIELKAGYIWLFGKLFSMDAGANDYVGFNIKKGSFTIKNDKKWNGQFLDFKGDFSGTLTIQLTQPDKNAFDLEGCSAAQKIAFKFPDEVTFIWEDGLLVKISGGDGMLDGYGNSLTFNELILPVSYNAPMNHVFIPCEADPQTWRADFSESQLFNAEGEAEIKSSFWALPIVRVTNPTTLGEPENNGGWGLRLVNEITARWLGTDKNQPNAIPTNPWIIVYPCALLFYSIKTKVDTSSALKIDQTFSCWNISKENAQQVPLHITYKDEFTLIYYCHASEGETLMAGCIGKIKPDRPVFAEGSLSILDNLTGMISFQAKGKEVSITTFLQDSNALKKQPKPYALENALMIVSQAVGLYLIGNIANDNRNNIRSGSMTLVHGLFKWKPILPDPYVSNLKQGWDVEGKLQRNPKSELYAQVAWEDPKSPIVTYKGDMLLSSSLGIQPKSEPNVRPLSSSKISENQLGQIEKNSINDKQKEEKNRLEQPFEDIEKSLSGWKLLDVSTNMDLIGVSVSPNLFRQGNDTSQMAMVSGTNISKSNAFVVKNLAVCTPLSMVHVFTLPQVQWEPVRTLPEDQNIAALGWFPENLSSASDGGPTRLMSFSQELSPIIPDLVVRQVKEEFSKGKEAIALTTLSFGLKAGLRLMPLPVTEVKVIENGKEKIITPGRNPDSLDIVRPDFSNKKMKGGIQLNLMAESGMPYYESPSAGFEGMMVQTLNGYELFSGTEMGLSVLGATFQPDASVETQFNKEFGPNSNKPFVPVTRFDLSGYGGSNFSEWENPAALASIGQVQFKIMVGRTAFEVVKFVSKIYPWGTTVTRSVTIERRSGGGIVRKDSGWQATQAGLLDFRLRDINDLGQFLDNPFKFNPGVFRGCFDINNIRPASNNILRYDRNNPAKGFFKPEPSDIPKPIDIEDGKIIEIAPVYFDANVKIDVQKIYDINSRGVLGFIQLEPKPDKSTNPWTPRLLSENELQQLIIQQGAIGGPIDNLLNIGNTGFKFRATRFEMDITENAGTPTFVCVVRGQPVLPNNGSWSVVKIASPDNVTDPQEATSADASRGTPLLLKNDWFKKNDDFSNEMHLPINSDNTYRFADPSDLFTPDTPRFDYGFMQNTGSQAFLFRRPVIVSGSNEITSTLKAAFADPFALFSTKGVFPPVANAIELPNSNYKLLVHNGTGKLKLSNPVNLPNPRSPLSMAQDGVNQIVVEYDQSILRYELNEDNWKAELDTFYVWTSMVGINKLFGNRFSLRSGSEQQSKLIEVMSLMNPDIRNALSFIPGFQDQRVKDIELGMTNGKHETRIVAGYQCKIGINLKSGKVKVKCLPKAEEPAGFQNDDSTLEIKFKGGIAAGISNDLMGDKSFALDAKLGVGLQAKIPVTGVVFIVLGLDVGVGWSILPKSKTKLKIGAYAGIGAGTNIGPFGAQAYIAGGIIYVWDGTKESWLWLVKLEAGIDLGVVSVNISAELQGYISGGDGIASGEVAVNVSIFLVINISATYTYEEKKKIGI